MPSSPPDPASPVEEQMEPEEEETTEEGVEREGSEDRSQSAHPTALETAAASASTTQSESTSDTSARLDAMQQERDNLRDEVTQLRKSLETLQSKHSEEVSTVRQELEKTSQGKESAEAQYRTLLGKVNTIRSQLGERLKADAEELEHTRGKIEELESERTTAREENQHLQDSISKLNSRLEAQTTEIDGLRNRTSLSTSNWAKERDDMVAREAFLREEYEVARQAMQDWEILATEERSRREALDERFNDLEDQLNGSKEAYERVKGDAETQGSTVDGLQRALREMQEERKRELRELVEQSQSQLEQLRTQAAAADSTSAEVKQQLESSQKELERALPFEKEVREKNLLIGKLRHEAVILNDHLTKALRFLRRGKPEDNVDRQLVTNHVLHFIALDRGDPKKFQVLQLIAALLGWSEEQREQAGLVRQGTGSLKLPVSPFRRTPSTPALNTDFVPDSPSGASKESLAELWSEFLEREAEAGKSPGTTVAGGSIISSRRGSVANSLRSPSLSSYKGMFSPLGPPPAGKNPLTRGESADGKVTQPPTSEDLESGR
nr:grip domain-containing protein [Quercus suber]